jgi:nucleotide-binding universal stress UspA family protein
MLNIKKILLPVDFPVASLAVVHQAATLAHHFNSEIVLLHVVTERSHTAGVPEGSREMADWDLLTAIIQQAQKQQDQSLGPALEGLTVERKLMKGDVAKAIVQAGAEARADLIMMPSHSFTFYQFLMGSVTAKVLHGTECPVWTGAHVQGPPERKFVIRNILCAVDFGPHAQTTASWAAQLAEEFEARLTLANVIARVDLWGPGGNLVDQRWKEALFNDASRYMTKLQQEMGIKAEVFIGSGDVPKVLSQAAKETNADLLVTGCYPYGGHLRTHGYGIICAVQIPVLNV